MVHGEMSTMRIQVTEEDIHSSDFTTFKNPVTRALQREMGGQWLVFGGQAAAEVGSAEHLILLPAEVYEQWIGYEATGTMQPFDFELPIPARNRETVFKSTP